MPKLRLREFPKADWRFLVRAAENTARAFHFIHQAGVVIGDVSHSNLLVANDATIRCIDCDSFQITADAQHWLCRVGTGDYQPPEMQGLTSYEGIVRTPNHDNFGLAVIIFRLLFAGRHPFSGRWQGKGDAPPIEDAIKASRYAYSQRRRTGIDPPGNALSVKALPEAVRDMFELAFDPGTTAGGRPTAEHWMTALQTLGRTVRQCRTNRWHWFYAGAAECPWCEIERSGAVLFGATAAPQQTASQSSAPSQVASQAPMPMPPPVPALLSRQTAVRLFAWTRTHRKAILWVTGFLLIIWLACRPAAIPPPPQTLRPQPSPRVVTAPAPPVQQTPAPPPQSSPSPAAKPALPPPTEPVPVPAAAPSTVAAPAPVPSLPAPAPAPAPVPSPPPVAGSPQVAPLAPVPFEPPNAAGSIGPTYDCLQSKSGLARFICSDADLSRIDIELVQPYYVLRQQVGKDGWEDLFYELKDFLDQTKQDCKIDDDQLPENPPWTKTCLADAYRHQRSIWLSKLSGEGLQEAIRPVEQHIVLLRRLQALGFLGSTTKVEGVYGPSTRAAIIDWQKTASRPASGFLGDSAANLLLASQPTVALLDGQRDRKDWELWFAGTAGQYRAGARYWTTQRSLAQPGSCSLPKKPGEWTDGCIAAQQRLGPTDVRRHAEPEYRRGWNSY